MDDSEKTLKIPLTEGEPTDRVVIVEDRELIDGVRIENNFIVEGALYPTVNESKPYLYFEQIFDADNPNVKWSWDITDFVHRAMLIERFEVLDVVASLPMLNSKWYWDFLYRCNCETRDKEQFGRVCYYEIPLVQGIPPTVDRVDLGKHPFVVSVHKAVGIDRMFCVQLKALRDREIHEHCRMDLRDLPFTAVLVEGLLRKRWVGDKMYIK